MNLHAVLSPELVAALEQLVDERVEAALAARENGGKRWLSVREAGELLGCSERAVYRRIETKRVPPEAVKHSGRRVYLDRRELDRAMERSL